MSELPQEPFPLFVYIIVSGSILAGIFEWIRYYFTRKREEYIDLSKHRMDVISKSSPYLFQIATYAFNLHLELNKNKPNAAQFLYYLSCFLYARNRIFVTVGGIQLDDLNAEEVISTLINNIHNSIRDDMGLESLHIVQKLVDENHNFHSFKTSTIPNNSQFYNDFCNWLSTVDKKILVDISNKSLWLYYLMDFEMNRVYRLWYGQKPNISQIDNELRRYLKEKFPEYSKKIESTGKKRFGRLSAISK